MIESTLYITEENMLFIENTAEKLNKSKAYVVRTLLKLAMDNYRENIVTGIRSRNQKRDCDSKKIRFHILYHESMYEAIFDLKKSSKLSVSNILFLAIKDFANEIMLKKDNQIDMDNYPGSYVIDINFKYEVPVFTIVWGIPQTIQEILPSLQ